MADSLFQEMLGASGAINTNVDVVFVIDATESMNPLLEKVKELTLSFRKQLEEGLERNRRHISQLRTKVIVFRDYYVDDVYAMDESKFYTLPMENDEFQEFVNGIQAGGGGDEPESGLEALALAMRSKFTMDGDKKRHIIVLFTDASAHPFELQKEGIPYFYPANMFQNLGELYNAWGMGQESLGSRSANTDRMLREAKRLVLFAPSVYPWTEMELDLENCIRKDLDKGLGGADLDLADVIALVVNSIA